MAEPYLTRLGLIVDGLGPPHAGGITLESRHFFSGAALYSNGKICVSLSPAGLAVKLPGDIRKSLVEEGVGKEFRFFANGPVKREYVALSESTISNEESMRELIALSVDYVLDTQDQDSVADE